MELSASAELSDCGTQRTHGKRGKRHEGRSLCKSSPRISDNGTTCQDDARERVSEPKKGGCVEQEPALAYLQDPTRSPPGSPSVPAPVRTRPALTHI